MSEQKENSEAPENKDADNIENVETGDGGDNTTKEEVTLFDQHKKRPITEEMSESYLTYAMSVIVSRALPDVRDGLKPVHRRIMYSMHELGLHASSRFRKSAAVVGDVLAKYHPHGDTAVYDSMVRMAQDFAMRYPLINGQGNFGSIDGDNAAAMRYTEAKMQKISDDMLADIEKETVNFSANYDSTRTEPNVLPARVPQLLLNGTMGIAVGMATNIPPHNLTEIIDGVIHLAKNEDATIDDLMEFIKGPDFPTHGSIYDAEAIKTMYATGRGGIMVRAEAEIEELKNGKFQIIITEIPYQVNKSTLVTKIADLVRDKKIVGISDLRDESNREGIRIVIELKKEAYPKKILNQLFKYTQMQTSFNMNMIALVDGLQPRLLNLKQVLEYFILHRKEVIIRRTTYDLRIAKARAHILEGLKIALDNIDKVIETIRKSETKDDAQTALMSKFGLTELQAKAILEMRLQTLAGLERKKIEDELAEKLALIAELEGILADPEKVKNIMIEELEEMKIKYGDARRTRVFEHALGKFSSKQLIPNEPMVVILTRENYIKRVSPSSFKQQRRGGKGIIGGTTKEEDEIAQMINVYNHDEVLYFTNKGRVFKLPVYELPQTSRTAKGQAIVNLLQLGEDEKITAMLNAKEDLAGKYLFMATINGTVKKTPVEDFSNIRKTGLIAIKLREDDSLEWVKQTNGKDKIILVTRDGKSIQFEEEDVRSMGRPSQGVRGMKLKGDDRIVEMDVIKPDAKTELIVITENGLGKCTDLSNYRLQGRGGTGVKTASLTAKTGKIVGAKIIYEGLNGDVIVISKKGQVIRMPIEDIPSRGRATQGVYLMRVNDGDHVASISLIPYIKPEDDEDDDNEINDDIDHNDTESVKSENKDNTSKEKDSVQEALL